MLLATAFSLLLLVTGVLFLDRLLGTFGLEPQVHYIAKMYIAAIGVGVLPFFLSTALRALVDTSGYTGITMKIYLLALPVNAFLNYCLIFGKFGAPALGGIGAGLAKINCNCRYINSPRRRQFPKCGLQHGQKNSGRA